MLRRWGLSCLVFRSAQLLNLLEKSHEVTKVGAWRQYELHEVFSG